MNFIKNRSSKVKLPVRQKNGKLKFYYSRQKLFKEGVPQGSTLGPICFILYTNSMFEEIPKGITIRAYADDVHILVTHQKILVLQRLLQKGLNHITNWATKALLNFNMTQSTYSLYGSADEITLFLTAQNQLLRKENDPK